MYNSCDMETVDISSNKAQKQIKPLWWHKFILAVILRGQPTLYDRRFMRYGKSCNFLILGP